MRPQFPSFSNASARAFGQDWLGKGLIMSCEEQEQPSRPSLAARIERALVLLAYFIGLDGDVHVAMYEKFEAELEGMPPRKTALRNFGARLSVWL
jgi:hypothetical protein